MQSALCQRSAPRYRLPCSGVAKSQRGSIWRLRKRPSRERQAIHCQANVPLSCPLSIAVLIGVGATLAWQSTVTKQGRWSARRDSSLAWLPVSTTKLTPNGQVSTRCGTSAIGAGHSDISPTAAATTPEFAQLEPMARDLAAMRRSLEQLAVKQEQMAQNIATVQAIQQDIRQKMSSRPRPRRPPTNHANPEAQRTPVACAVTASAFAAARHPMHNPNRAQG